MATEKQPTVERFLSDRLWVHRMEQAFKSLDSDEDLYVSLSDVLLWVDNLEKLVNADEKKKELATLREVAKRYGMAEGLSEEKITVYEYVIGVAKFAVKEFKSFQEGGIEETLSAKMTNAMMDVVAEPGFITAEGYKKLTSATNFDTKNYTECEPGKFTVTTQSAAETIFAQLGEADNIERKVIIHSQVHFFLNNPSPDTKGLLGSRFEL